MAAQKGVIDLLSPLVNAEYRKQIRIMSARIFGNLPPPEDNLRRGNKHLRKKLIGAQVASYYTVPWRNLMDYDYIRNRDLTNLERAEAGNPVPKKGQGKRSKKKK